MPRGTRTKSHIKHSRHVPYVKGFRRPTQKQQLRAIGTDQLPRQFQPGEGYFQRIPLCNSIDDWLAQYDDMGQTFQEYERRCPWFSSRKVKSTYGQTFVSSGFHLPQKYPNGKIYIVPIGDFDSCCKFDVLVEYARLFFCLPVETLPLVKVEENGKLLYWITEQKDGTSTKKKMPCRSHGDQKQVHVDGPLNELKNFVPDDAICLIALTMNDLFADNTDLFVAGMASGIRGVAIFSLFRYNPNMKFSPEFWYDIETVEKFSKEETERLVMLRSCRLLVHEVSHLLGIGHCIFYACCMNGSGHLQEDFSQPMYLCPVDLRKLQRLCGFNVLDRYQGLADFFKKYGHTEELAWITKRMAFINDTTE